MELLFPLLILALLVPTFLGVRRQKKEMQKVTALQDSLNVGDRVATTAGLHATITGLRDDTVDLEIAPGVVTEWSRLVIRERIEEPTETDDLDSISLRKDDNAASPESVRPSTEAYARPSRPRDASCVVGTVVLGVDPPRPARPYHRPTHSYRGD